MHALHLQGDAERGSDGREVGEAERLRQQTEELVLLAERAALLPGRKLQAQEGGRPAVGYCEKQLHLKRFRRVSNARSRIDDYIRKRVSYEPQQKRRTAEDGLPLIDIQIYKREEALLR